MSKPSYVSSFDCDHQPRGSQPSGQPPHQKPTATSVSRRLQRIRASILRLRSNLHDIDRMLNDIHEVIREIEDMGD